MLIHAKLLDQVSEARPLAKLQEELENHQDGPEGLVERIAAADSASADDSTDSKDLLSASSDSGGSSLSTPRKPLLNDSDNELERISSVSLSNYWLGLPATNNADVSQSDTRSSSS